MPSPRSTLIAVLIVVLSCLLLPLGVVRAAEIRSGDNPSVEPNETVDDDVYIFGGTVSVDGNVTRDLFVTAGTVDIRGQVGGDVNVAAGDVTIDGPVGGTVRVVSGTLRLRNAVGWDVLVAGGEVTLDQGATIAHDLRIASGEVRLNGSVGRDIRGGAGLLTINGQVDGSVRVEIDDELVVGPQARIDGDLEYAAEDDAEIATGATIGGQTIRREPGWFDDSVYSIDFLSGLSWYFGFFLRLAWALLAGTLLVLLFPWRTSDVAETLRDRPLISIGWGFALFFLTPILILLLLITVVGIPVALVLTALYLIALYLSQVIVGTTLGMLILQRSWRERNRLQLWLAMLLGVTVVVLVRLLPLPFFWSFWWSLVIGMLALGAIWTAFTGLGRGPRMPSPLPAQEGPPATSAATPAD